MSKWAFFREFLRSPGRVGALWPSSETLAQRMVNAAALKPGQVVVELGAGVGPMTSKLYALRKTVRLIALEPNPRLTAILQERMPELDVVEAYAEDLHALLRVRGLKEIDCIISGLPWAIWPEDVRGQVLDTLHSVMRPQATLLCFSYIHLQPFRAGRGLRRALRHRFQGLEVAAWAWPNLPPALVYRCYKG